jgi:hypothetical protein
MMKVAGAEDSPAAKNAGAPGLRLGESLWRYSRGTAVKICLTKVEKRVGAWLC